MKNTKPWNRLLSLVLCLTMVLGLMPAAVFAAEDTTGQTFTVSFAGPGSGYLEPITAEVNTQIDLPCGFADVAPNGTKVFMNFNTNADGSGETYEDCTKYTVTGDVTLYTQWADIAIGNAFLNDGQYLDCNGNVSDTKPQGGYAHYAEQTLTLNNYVYSGEGYEFYHSRENNIRTTGLVYAQSATTLVLEGENELTVSGDDQDGMRFDGDATISGSGTLTLNGGTYSIFSFDTITFAGGELNLLPACNGIWADNLIFTGGMVHVVCKSEKQVYAMRSNNDISFDGVELLHPVGGTLQDTYLVDANGSMSKVAVVGTACVNHTDADMDGACDVCSNACSYTVKVDNTITDYTDFSDALASACRAEVATLTLYQNVPETIYTFSQGNVTLDLNGMTLEGRLCVDDGTLTMTDSTGGKGTVLNYQGAAFSVSRGKLILLETLDLLGLTDDHQPIRIGMNPDVETITFGSTGEENIVIPAALVAISIASNKEVSVLDYVGDVAKIHQHNWVEATCTEDAYCLSCQTKVEALGHSYDEGVEKLPTCTDKGYLLFTCANCGDTYTENEVPALGHSFESDVCTLCGASGEITIRLTDNYGDGWNGNALQIYENGELLTTATIDDGSEATVTVPYYSDKVYTFVWVKGEYPTECVFDILLNEETLFSRNNCSGFDDAETVYTICSHSYGEGIETEASCKQKGGIYFTCTKCGDLYIENEVPALGHSFGDDDICDTCGAERSLSVTVNMTDDYGDGWNDNIIEIVSDQESVDTLTIIDGDADTWIADLNPKKHYDFYWSTGEYADECAFEVLIEGEVVFEKTDCSNYKQGQLIFSIIDGEVVVPVIVNSVYVSGVELFEGDYLDLEGNVSTEEPTGGYAYFDGTILTLNDYTYSGTGLTYTEGEISCDFLIYTESEELELEVLGTNSLTHTGTDGWGILMGDVVDFSSPASLTLSGSGTLNLSGLYAVSQLTNLTINGGIYNFETENGIYGFSSESVMTVNGGELNITTANDASFITLSIGELTLNGGRVILTSANTYALVVDTLTVNGGYLEVKNGGMTAYHPDYDEPIILGPGVTIVSPEGAVFGTFTNENDLLVHTINDADGNMADAFTIEYVAKEFAVPVYNSYGFADAITLSNSTAFPGQDYVTTISSTVGTGIEVTGVYIADEDMWYGNGIYEFDSETNTLTVYADYVAEGMQIEVVPYVTLTIHMNGGTILDDYWNFVYKPDENGIIRHSWFFGEEDYFFPVWDETIEASVPAPNRVFVRDGYTVVEYNTAADGTGTSYPVDALYQPTEDTELYLIWERVSPVQLDSAALSFNEKIHYNIFFTLDIDEDIALADMGLIMFDSLNADGTMDDAIATYSGAVEMDGKYMVATDGVHAKRLGDTIYLRVYAKLADGSFVYSKTVEYSAATYAKNILNSDKPESAKALVVAMLNYGAEAQMFFNYNTDDLVNTFLTEDQKTLPETYRADMVSSIPVVPAEKQGTFANNQGFVQKMPAVSFEDAFSINYLFTPAYMPVDGITLYYWTEADFGTADVLTVENASGFLKMDGTGTSQYRCDIDGIAAKNLSNAVYVAAVYSDGATTWTSGVLGYSIGAYCASFAAKGGAMADLAMATAVYGYHAKQYFG